MTRHFLKCTDFSPSEIEALFVQAREYKAERARGHAPVLRGQTWALLFDKSSTRTRVSFEVGIHELGGNPLFLDQGRTQLGRGETAGDTAKVLSRYLHGLIVRTHAHSIVEELAREGSIPVINGLTDFFHPCQVYTDLFTLAERWAQPDQPLTAALKGRKLVFLGDTDSNMAHSLILGGLYLGMQVALAGPARLQPDPAIDHYLAAINRGPDYVFSTDPREVIQGADAVYTDVWVSMGDEGEKAQRLQELRPYQVTQSLMQRASADACFLHCLPAHEGEEVTTEVYRGPQSIVFDQAENRLHVQKAILTALARARQA